MRVIDRLSKAIRSKYPDKKGYSTRNLIYMCQFAKAYPIEILRQLANVDEALETPSIEKIIVLTRQLNLITQQPVALFSETNKQHSIIMQQPVAQFEEVTETLSSIYQADIAILEQIFKKSAVVRTNGQAM